MAHYVLEFNFYGQGWIRSKERLFQTREEAEAVARRYIAEHSAKDPKFEAEVYRLTGDQLFTPDKNRIESLRVAFPAACGEHEKMDARIPRPLGRRRLLPRDHPGRRL